MSLLIILSWSVGFTALLMGLTMPPGALLSVAFFGRMSIKAAAVSRCVRNVIHLNSF
jgi:hypothetical protein